MALAKILVAEDDGDDQKLFIDFLGHREDIVILPMVENGVELFEFLDPLTNTEELPDFIILDQNMPKMNGLQTLLQIKSTARYSSIPVMVYSTYIDQNLVSSCTEAGACAVTTKPISREGYNEMVDELMKLK